MNGVILYALGDFRDIFSFLFGTWVAILGVNKHSNEVDSVAASVNVFESVETSFGGANVPRSFWAQLGS
jgi:ethanolamine ammonia-lyase large subunit